MFFRNFRCKISRKKVFVLSDILQKQNVKEKQDTQKIQTPNREEGNWMKRI